MKEEWKICKGFEPFYEVSNTGKVRSIAVWSEKYKRIIQRPHAKERKQEETKDGYMRVLLCYYGKHYHCAVHRLVAQAFIQNPNDFPCINHKDEDTKNNNVENLEWCTWKYNSNYGTLPKRISNRMQQNHPSARVVNQYSLDGTLLATYPSMKKAAQSIKTVSSDMIGRVCRGQAKTAGGYLWKYVNY